MGSQCNDSFFDYLVQCNEEINVFAQLAPNTTYQWVITDKFQRQYAGTFTTNADGFWSIPTEDLPGGMLNEFAGTFHLQVFEDAYATCAPIKFLIAQEYDTITFNIRAGSRIKNNLGCEF